MGVCRILFQRGLDPFPSPLLPSLSLPPILPFPLEVGPPSPLARGLGEHLSSPSGAHFGLQRCI